MLISAFEHDYFKSRLTDAERATYLLYMWMKAERISVTWKERVLGVADDYDDDMVLSTALAAQAPYLVTADKGLLALESYRGVAIVSIEGFGGILRESLKS